MCQSHPMAILPSFTALKTMLKHVQTVKVFTVELGAKVPQLNAKPSSARLVEPHLGVLILRDSTN